MAAIFSLSQGKERFLVSPYEILAMLPPKAKFDEDRLECVLQSLELDGYFELVYSDRKGEKTYCVHMRESGLAYRRQDVQRKRDFATRLLLAGVCGLLSAAIGLLLKAILS
ncbi:MAG: hypothetical protein IKD43_03615 [Clostridia bacterium]|nr:hypothetical protein [Clostridia bacterium]